MFRIQLFDNQAMIAKCLLAIFSLVIFFPFSAAHSENNGVSLAAKSYASEAIYNIKHKQTQIVVGSIDKNKRSVNLLVSYPVGDKLGQQAQAHVADNQQYPLIVFSHGHALDNKSYQNLTDYWVSRGFFVVAPLHLDSGGDLNAVSLISKKFGNDWIAASRLLDLSAVINQIDVIVSSLSDFKGSVLTDKVIAAGHSYGALSSQQLAGAMLERNGDSIYPIPESLSNSKVAAVVAISPPGLMKDHITEATWEGFNMPQLVVTGPNDFFPFIWPNYEDHFISYLTADKGHNYLLTLDQMDHYLGNLIGRLERSQTPQTLALKNLQTVSMSFIRHYLSQPLLTEVDLESTKLLEDFEMISEKEGVLKFEHR